MTLIAWIKSFALALILLLGFVMVAQLGCGLNTSLTEKQQDKDLTTKMAWVNKAIEVAEQHGLAYRVEVNASGRPSIGENVDLYIDTGVSARIIMFGNGAAGRPTNPKGKLEPADIVEASKTQAVGGGR